MSDYIELIPATDIDEADNVTAERFKLPYDDVFDANGRRVEPSPLAPGDI